MPSSISNSDSASRAPAIQWIRVWFITFLLVVTLFLSLEAILRLNGYRPSITDNPSLWAYHRSLVSRDSRQVVLLGASRMQLGFSTTTFRNRFPTKPLSVLAIAGSKGPVATLHDLAEDENFRGTIICSVTASHLKSDNWQGQQLYVDQFHNTWPHQHLEAVIQTRCQRQLAVLNPSVNLLKVVDRILRKGRLPLAPYAIVKSDRSRIADYSMPSAEGIREMRVARRQKMANSEPPCPFEQWAADVTALKSSVDKIHKRGGAVVFVRFPTTDEHWLSTEGQYPKTVFWDQLSKLSGASTIHFLDTPSLSQFDCPDTSHLDARDSPKFTDALLDELMNQGILPKN